MAQERAAPRPAVSSEYSCDSSHKAYPVSRPRRADSPEPCSAATPPARAPAHATASCHATLLSPEARAALLGWMAAVAGAQGLGAGELGGAVALLEAFLARAQAPALPPCLLQLLALACLRAAGRWPGGEDALDAPAAPEEWLVWAAGPDGEPLYQAADLERMAALLDAALRGGRVSTAAPAPARAGEQQPAERPGEQQPTEQPQEQHFTLSARQDLLRA